MAVDSDSKHVKINNGQSAKESHKAQKVLLNERKAAKPHADMLSNAKRIWNLARQKNVPEPERRKHVQDLMNVIRGNVKDIVFKHDASRIVQTVVKYGKQDVREEIAEELKGSYKELVQKRYSKFLVNKLIKQCPSHRAAILLEFKGNVIRLLLHREASRVIADAYELYGNAYERSILLRDFYGKEAALFSMTSGSDADKERSKKGLKGVLEGAQGETRKRVLNALKENLLLIFNNSDKGAVTHGIVHHALWEYITEVNAMEDEAEREKLFREMFDSCQDVLAEMVHTKHGSRVVREFIARGTAKDRKHIIKALKPHIERICTDDEAQLVLFTALDCIDDTKLLAKSVVTEITSKASMLYTCPQGRRSLLYLIVPRSRRHFTPAQIALLAETDALKAGTSKKDDQTRREEVRKAASEGLLDWIARSGKDVVRDPGGSLVVSETMLSAEGDKTGAMESLLKAVASPYPGKPDLPHPIDLPHTARVYKNLLQGGHFDHTTLSVSRSPSFSSSVFAEKFVQIVGKDVTLAMAKGNGAFVVAELLERVKAEGSDELRKEVRAWFSGQVKKEIEGADMKGKKVLLEKIDALSS
ncbi:ARM repeat-containing protein [Gloeophyllum trabeum ATCC 11539]|uniref:ARM repeat-containing protein n=1 Tax=Gloeophyllum trabeum (strain ATCC 11539 / FP-39264 / Madison 617) TaxID=670483 RepID=S7RBA6_GLOTA|nr:ARM repeat-containing protein [Gloeophyllum trabeum ATCC 11539]EPQ51495.1 ARM repeat-containing protein [Gloeophyllum trabeum ATCC 11539]